MYHRGTVQLINSIQAVLMLQNSAHNASCAPAMVTCFSESCDAEGVNVFDIVGGRKVSCCIDCPVECSFPSCSDVCLEDRFCDVCKSGFCQEHFHSTQCITCYIPSVRVEFQGDDAVELERDVTVELQREDAVELHGDDAFEV